MMRKKLFVGSVSAVMLFGGLLATSSATAAEWRPNSPSEIQVVAGQKEYTMKWGDTLWAIGQKVNIKHEKLAEINGINLQAGDQFNIPVGRILSFGENVVTVKEADGSTYSQSVIGDKDKITQEKNIGETTGQTADSTSDTGPYAVDRNALSYPATFNFQGGNMPKTVTLDFSQEGLGSVVFTFDSNHVEEYMAGFHTIATKEVEVYTMLGNGEGKTRTVKVNTEITMQPVENYPNQLVPADWNMLYLFINENGGISLIVPMYGANNYEGAEGLTMMEVFPAG